MGRSTYVIAHSSCVSLRGNASQLLVLTGPFKSLHSVYIAVILARLIMNPGFRILGSGSGSVPDTADEALGLLVVFTTGFNSAYLK